MPGQTNPVRDAVRAEILSALAGGQSFMSHELYSLCQSAVDPKDVARVAHELVKKGLLVNGEKAAHPLGMSANTYRLPTDEDPRIAAAKPIVVERKIPKTGKPPKPAQDHPFRARIVAQEAHDGAPRVTRPLPTHLQSTAPQAAAVAIDEAEMSEEPMPYFTDVDTFSQEPMELEADPDIDDELTSLLSEVAALKPDDDAMAMASEYVGDQADTRKVCQCLRINSLPRLPKGYAYGGIKVWIESEHDVGRLTIATHDEGGGAFASIKASGRLSFDPGDLVAIGQVADALIRLHEEMGNA